jgi:hypothetical protein
MRKGTYVGSANMTLYLISLAGLYQFRGGVWTANSV